MYAHFFDSSNSLSTYFIYFEVNQFLYLLSLTFIFTFPNTERPIECKVQQRIDGKSVNLLFNSSTIDLLNAKNKTRNFGFEATIRFAHSMLVVVFPLPATACTTNEPFVSFVAYSKI